MGAVGAVVAAGVAGVARGPVAVAAGTVGAAERPAVRRRCRDQVVAVDPRSKSPAAVDNLWENCRLRALARPAQFPVGQVREADQAQPDPALAVGRATSPACRARGRAEVLVLGAESLEAAVLHAAICRTFLICPVQVEVVAMRVLALDQERALAAAVCRRAARRENSCATIRRPSLLSQALAISRQLCRRRGPVLVT